MDASNVERATAMHRPRLWPLAAILFAVTATVAGLQMAPGEGLPAQYRNLLSGIAVAAAVAALFGWLALFSRLPLRRRIRLVVAGLCVLAAPLAVVDHLEFTGDIVPRPVFRWQADRFEALEAHRRQAARAAPGAPHESDSALAPLDADWSGYRGSNRKGTYAGPPLRTNWVEQPPKLIWKQPVGEGHSQIALSGNLAVTLEQRGPNEAIVCYDARTSAEQWVHIYPERFAETMGGDGPRSTPTIDAGEVFALGARGRLSCLALNDGAVHWETNILKQDGQENLTWGMSGSPLVLRDMVILSPGGPASSTGHAVVAYDRRTGQQAWGVGSAPGGYASPDVATIDGVEQIIVFDGAGVSGYRSDGAAELWRYPWDTQGGINCSQPIFLPPNRLLITAGYRMGAALLELTIGEQGTWNVKPVWEQKTLHGKFSTPVVNGDHVYGLDEGILVCLDLETGKRRWKQGRYGHGQMLLADGVLFIQAENGDLALVALNPQRHEELARIPALTGRTWNTPALAVGRAFVRNHQEMACFDLRNDRRITSAE